MKPWLIILLTVSLICTGILTGLSSHHYVKAISNHHLTVQLKGEGDFESTNLGGKLVYSSEQDSNSEIYVVDANGKNQTRLTYNNVGDYDPEWSPDGTKIAFSSYRDGNEEIYIMNADGTNPVRLTDNTARDWDPTWSSDGTRIAFISDGDCNNRLWVMQSDGSSPIEINTATAHDPEWSPDGSRIAFVCPIVGPATDAVCLVNPDGSSLTEIIWGHDLGRIAWSPDGQKLAVPGTMQSVITIFNIDGNSQNVNFGICKYDPTWSPDGSKLCFMDASVLPNELTIFAADGTSQLHLPNISGFHPSWCLK